MTIAASTSDRSPAAGREAGDGRIRVAVLASGGGTNLQALLDYFAAPGATAMVALVVSNREDAGALGRAGDRGIPTAVVRTDDDGVELLAVLERHTIQLVALAGYLKLVPAGVLARFGGRVLNVHPGPLPEFGGPGMYGRRVHERVIAAGLRESCVTVHLVDAEYDHGPALVRWPVPVHPEDDAAALAARVLAVEHIVFPRAVETLAAVLLADRSTS